MRRGPNRLGALPIAAVALAFRCDRLSLALAVARKRASYVVAILELTLRTPTDVPLIALVRLDEFALRHDSLSGSPKHERLKQEAVP
jgi:hypothetical protein